MFQELDGEFIPIAGDAAQNEVSSQQYQQVAIFIWFIFPV